MWMIPEVTPHVCHHTYCSNMAKTGINPKSLQYLMSRNSIDKDEINIFPGSSDLHFYMGKISIMHFAFVKQRKFYLAFPAVTQLRSKYPLIVI